MKLLLLISTVFLISSCAFHRGSLNPSTIAVPVVHKDIAMGVSSTSMFLGIGGTSYDALVYEARQDLIRNRPLVDAEKFDNISVDVKTNLFLGVVKTKVTIIADVVEPKDSATQASYSEVYLQKTAVQKIDTNDLFSIGDSVYFHDSEKTAEIINFKKTSISKARIKYYSKQGNLRTRLIKLTRLYAVVPSYRGYKLGDNFSGSKITAFGIKGVMVDIGTKSSFPAFFPYP